MLMIKETKIPMAGIHQQYFTDETQLVNELVTHYPLADELLTNAQQQSQEWILAIRQQQQKHFGVNVLLHEFGLTSEEGIALMCLAEALLRIPDKATADQLIADKISGRQWQTYINKSSSLFVNATAWGLMVSGSLLNPQRVDSSTLKASLNSLFNRLQQPIIRQAVSTARGF
jgi:RHH-type proline utilization regulon transcriptional repressor/proline dehydrogenase/delta 1-pyrroline-5-carboxylate dehydrogenase